MAHRLVLALALLSAGCAEEFEEYNQVTGFRVLGLASDKPALAPEESAIFSALVTSSDVSYRWSWCPLSGGAQASFECSVTESELQSQLDETFGEGMITVPPFDLGSGSTAELSYPLPRELIAGLCDFFLAGELPEGVPVPSCDGAFDMQIRLEASAGGETIVAVRDQAMLFDLERAANTNPALGAIFATAENGGSSVELSSEMPTLLARETSYELRVDVTEEQAESYMGLDERGQPEAQRERLFLSWFREAGEMDKGRSSFIAGESGIDVLQENTWITPTLADYPDSILRLYFVLRDNRGGLSWASREVELETP